MIKKLVFGIVGCLRCVGAASADEFTPDEWIGQLASPKFEERIEATEKVWELGENVLPLLEPLVEHHDPEVAARAVKVVQKIRTGITPDTPEEIVQIIENYFAADIRGKGQAIRKLRKIEAHEYLLRLYDLEKNPEVRPLLEEVVNKILPTMLLKELLAKNFTRVRELLAIGTDFVSLVRCGDFLDRQGELDAEIVRLREHEDEQSKKRYLAYLRVKGDLPFLLSEAKRLGDSHTAATASLMLGDVVPLFEYLLQRADYKPSDRFYLRWVLARHRGDGPLQDELLQKIVGLARDRGEEPRAVGNLYRSNQPELIWELFDEKTSWKKRHEYLEARDRKLEIPALFGTTMESVPEDWLAEKSVKILEEFDSEGFRPNQELFPTTARFYDSRGLWKEAAKVYKAFFDVLRQSPEDGLVDWIMDSGRWVKFNLRSRGACAALTREIDELQESSESVVEALYGANSPAMWLYHELPKLDEELKTEKLLRLIASFHGVLLVEEKKFEEWYAKVDAQVRKEYLKEGGGDDHGLRQLIKLCAEAGRGTEVLDLMLLREPANLNPDEILRRARYASYLEDWKKARLYHEAFFKGNYDSFAEYDFALVLMNAGEEEEGQRRFENALLNSNSDPIGAYKALSSAGTSHAEFGNHMETYRFYKQAYLRSWPLISLTNFSTGNLATFVAQEALRQRDWKTAMAFFEIATWQLGEFGGTTYLNSRFNAEFARGMRTFEQGDVKHAEVLLAAAHSLIPASGTLADEFFPALREAGLIELHDRLCTQSLDLSRKIIESFPRDANARNNFGWIASRAARQLDEAEEHMKVAVALEPRSEAYLDTFAEVWFARHNREEAIKWSRRSFENSVHLRPLRDQYRRFRFEDFPPR